jgi:peptidoglycan L-alanyl-D-glutamate endopeptidase CwlK
MPHFSQRSFSKLSTCHIDLQVVFFEVIKFFDCKVLEGHRNQEDQDAAYERGASQLRWPDGKHNAQPSLAVDVVPWPIPDWNKTAEFVYFGGFVMGVAHRLFEEGKVAHKLVYGGDFNQNERISDDNFKDYVHFQIIL